VGSEVRAFGIGPTSAPAARNATPEAIANRTTRQRRSVNEPNEEFIPHAITVRPAFSSAKKPVAAGGEAGHVEGDGGVLVSTGTR
jgi:hypothetical protein